ncbi:MAG: glycosyl hydrolase family 79 C-terminal domain-containing protein [Acidobacteriaceae bacterium]
MSMHNPRALLTRRGLLQGVVSLAAVSALPGCGYHSNYIYTPPSNNHLPAPSGPVVQGSLAVTTTAIGTIPSRFMGLSYEKLAMNYGYFHGSNYNLIALFRRLGAGVLRVGGGSADSLLWTPSKTGTHDQISPTNVRNLAAFLQATGWLCLYAVNLATSTPALAAEEVSFVVSTLGENLLGIEIGNEPDEYGAARGFFPGNWTFQDFIDRWTAFHSAILQAAPNVPVTGPADAGANHITTWTLPFGQVVTGSELTLLTQHYYRQSGASTTSTAEFLISPDDQLAIELGTLGPGARQLGIPYRMSECNSFANGGAAGVSNSYASSLWVLDFLFNVAMAGAIGVNMHGGGNAPGYTPIADDSGAVIEARPEYYGLLLFALAGTGTLMETQLSIGTVDATAYALKTPGGGLNLIVVNKDTLQNLTLTIQANQAIQTASMQLMTGPSLAAISGVTIQGATVNPDGTFAPASPGTLTPSDGQTTCFIPALSAALISIT